MNTDVTEHLPANLETGWLTWKCLNHLHTRVGRTKDTCRIVILSMQTHVKAQKCRPQNIYGFVHSWKKHVKLRTSPVTDQAIKCVQHWKILVKGQKKKKICSEAYIMTLTSPDKTFNLGIFQQNTIQSS